MGERKDGLLWESDSVTSLDYGFYPTIFPKQSQRYEVIFREALTFLNDWIILKHRLVRLTRSSSASRNPRGER